VTGNSADDLGARRRSSTVWLAGGVASILLALGFFVFIGYRDDQTLHHGEQVTAEVVALIQPAGWDFLDSGRIEVRYTIHDQIRTSRLWLDNELTDYQVGEQVTVYVHGGNIRTEREANDPAPVGMAAVLIGLAGFAALIRGVLLWREPRVRMVRESEGRLLVPLAAWRLAPRKAAIDVVDHQLRLYAPTYFANKRLVVPVDEVGVHALVPAPDEEDSRDSEEPEAWFENGIRFLDLPTKWQYSSPNLMLLFHRPARVPPVRWLLALNNPLPLGFWASRSERGELVDAVLVRCVQLDVAVDNLVRVGAQRVAEPIDWLAQRRATASDPVRISELRRQDALADRASKISTTAWAAAAVFGIAGRITDNLYLLAGAGLAIAAGLALPRLMQRRPPQD